MTAPALNRSAIATRSSTVPPVRIVHLGIGAFARAHQAWYTDAVDPNGSWGIAAFTGRSRTVADALGPQDGLYTLIERSATGDRAQVVSSIVEVHDGADQEAMARLLAAPGTALVTLTITEAGYHLAGDGTLDQQDPTVLADLRVLAGGAPPHDVSSTLARMVVGLAARMRADAGPITVVPCDNIADNGPRTRDAVRIIARCMSTDLEEWIDSNVSYVSTSVDRITPRTRAADISTAATLTGWADASPVVTEPFTDWVLSGSFPRGRPEWERAGARFVDDIEPFERRKLWLLNGAHSLLAYEGRLRGHRTVAEAIADTHCRAAVLDLWRDAARHLPTELLALDEYQGALLRRFENPRIEHRLDQIGEGGATKLRLRIVPVLLAERAAGRPGAAGAGALAAWVALHLLGHHLPDSRNDSIVAAEAAVDPVAALLRVVDPRLPEDGELLEAIRHRQQVSTEPSPAHSSRPDTTTHPV